MTLASNLAQAYLDQKGHPEWAPEIREMIHEHHEITRYEANPNRLVEAFRRADWIDVSRGFLTFGLRRAFLREVFATFRNAGFHKRLIQLLLGRSLSHPLNPLPMFRP